MHAFAATTFCTRTDKAWWFKGNHTLGMATARVHVSGAFRTANCVVPVKMQEHKWTLLGYVRLQTLNYVRFGKVDTVHGRESISNAKA